MRLIELSELQKDKFNNFVATHAGGSFLQAWEWGQWQARLGKEVSRFKIVDANAGSKGDPLPWLGAVQVIKMPVAGKYFYLYAPYGPVADVRCKIEDIRYMLRELQKKYPNMLFVRLEPQEKMEGLEQVAKKSVNIQPGITMVVDITQSDEKLLAGMHPKTRYNIKVAQRHGVEVQSELIVTPGHGLYMQEVIDAIVQTQDRQKYRGHNTSYYSQLLDFFALHNARGDVKVRVYKTLYQKKLVASGIMVDFGKIRMYLYGGSSDNFKNVMGPYLMHFQAMKDARELGMAVYDLGGIEVASGGERGFTRFKQGFGGKVVEYAGVYDIVFKKSWYTIYGIGRTINRLLKSK